MSTFLPELPTTERVPTWNLLRRLFRSLGGVLNRLGPWNFSPTAAFALARRVNQYSEQTLHFSQARITTAMLNRRVMAFQPTGDGEVIDWRVQAADGNAIPVGGDFSCRLFRNGTGQGAAITVTATTPRPDAVTVNSAFSDTDIFEVRITATSAALDAFCLWYVEVRLKQQLVASP